jgi:uncharacterized tellurite resistance protein B-like protein
LFLSELKELEKKAFFGLAQIMVSADGRITEEEREMLRDAAEEMEFDAGKLSLTQESSFEECCGKIISPKSRVQVLLELASFAFVDHDYDAQEQELLRAIANAWQMDEILVIEIEQWASRRVQLAIEAAEIIYEAETLGSN